MTTIVRQLFIARFVLSLVAFSVFMAAQLISGAGLCQAQTQSASAKAMPAVAKAATAAQKPAAQSPAKGTSTMIQISGRWVIEVRNPDGKVTARREFENAIQPAGMNYLAALLAGHTSPGQLSIMLNGAASSFGIDNPNTGLFGAYLTASASPGPCYVGAGQATTDSGNIWVSFGDPAADSNGPCVITAPPTSSSYTSLLGASCAEVNGACSTNLAVTAASFGNKTWGGVAANFTLSGSVVASASAGGNITDVETIFETCSNGSTPSGCAEAMSTKTGAEKSGVGWVAMNLFTEATLTSPVPYTPGQTIAATVTFSFSSPSS